jgi:hypothetical protein
MLISFKHCFLAGIIFLEMTEIQYLKFYGYALSVPIPLALTIEHVDAAS